MYFLGIGSSKLLLRFGFLMFFPQMSSKKNHFTTNSTARDGLPIIQVSSMIFVLFVKILDQVHQCWLHLWSNKLIKDRRAYSFGHQMRVSSTKKPSAALKLKQLGGWIKCSRNRDFPLKSTNHLKYKLPYAPILN